MKVLFATNHAYPPQRVGGSESSTHDLCLTLRELGLEVAVLCSSLPRRSTGFADRIRAFPRRPSTVVRDDDAGYPVYRAPSPVAAARELVAELAPDVAVVQAGRPLVLAERLTTVGVPCLVYLRDTSFDALGRSIRERDDLRYAATSQALAHRFAEACGIVPECLPPIVRPERYRVESTRTNVTFVCPFPEKGVDVALGLAERRPDIPFAFVESWQLRPLRRVALTRRIRRLPNVTLRRSTADMRDVYRDARLVLVPSRSPEAWGRVVSEAQVSGIPALARAAGGLRESVGDGGILLDRNAGLDDWERELGRIWDDPVEYDRLADAARRHAQRAEFEPVAIARRLRPLLTELARGGESGEIRAMTHS